MAGIKISALPTTGTAGSTDEIPTNTAGGTPTVKRTLAQAVQGGLLSVGPWAIGGATSAATQLLLTGAYSGQAAYQIASTLTPGVGNTAYGAYINPTIIEAGSGTHPSVDGLFVTLTVTNGAATTTDASAIRIPTFAAGAGTTNASGIKIGGAPTGATNNYALWVAAGISRYDDVIRGADGSAGTPGFSFQNDTNSGLYSPGGDILGFSTGGVDQVRITHTASATRYITLTGSNGGNPTIGTSAGNLAITPSVNFAGSIIVAATQTVDLAGSSGTNFGRFSYSSGGNTLLTIDNAFDDAAAEVRIRTRTLGTAINLLTGTATLVTLPVSTLASVGVKIGADSVNNLIDDATNGAGSTTLYIGNASINVTSDERVKRNIVPLGDGLSIVRALLPIEFDQDEERPWGDVQHYVGFGARHSHKVAPWSVNTQGDTGLPWKMRQEFLMAPAVRAIQQLDERLAALEARPN